jgi:hypothetical protein
LTHQSVKAEARTDALGKYSQTNADAGDIFFKVATGTEEDRKPKQSLASKDDESPECQLFKRYSYLILDLCDSVENADQEGAGKGQ